MTQGAGLGLEPFYAMEILARAKALEAEGRDVLYLQTGEPDVPPAPRVIEAVRAALPDAQRYTHSKGQLGLREAIARSYGPRHGVVPDAENLVVTMGSSAGFILAFLTAFAPGAAIAVTRPGYPAYLNTLVGLGYRPVEIPVTAENGWRLRAEDIAATHARTPFEGLLFASPANPTGASVDREGLAEIVQTCTRLGVQLISDEIYHGLDYGAPSTSALSLTRDAIIINSFSKYHCMTGWRIGWMIMPENLVRKTEMLQQNLFISAPTLSQIAARVALEETDYAEAQRARYAINRDRLTAGLARLGLGLSGAADGAFYAYADVSRFTNDSLDFCTRLLDQTGVATTPGIDFDRVDGNRFVRFSFAGAPESMDDALERIAGFLAREPLGQKI